MFFARSRSVAAPKATRTRAPGGSPRRRAAAVNLETLEARDLKSNIPGVELYYGTIGIQATQHSDNSTTISLDANTHTVQVTHNGQTATFSASEVYGITYVGGSGGRDTFANDTDIGSTMTGMGGSNHFAGGGSYNIVYMVGSDNDYDSRGASSYVFTYNGYNNTINGTNNSVYSYYY